MQNWLTKGGDAAVGLRGATVVQGGHDFVRFTFGEVQGVFWAGTTSITHFMLALGGSLADHHTAKLV